jgi:hypothetical protein
MQAASTVNPTSASVPSLGSAGARSRLRHSQMLQSDCLNHRISNSGPKHEDDTPGKTELVSQSAWDAGHVDIYGPSDESEALPPFTPRWMPESTCSYRRFHGMGHNEMLIRRAIEGRRKDVFLAVSSAPCGA